MRKSYQYALFGSFLVIGQAIGGYITKLVTFVMEFDLWLSLTSRASEVLKRADASKRHFSNVRGSFMSSLSQTQTKWNKGYQSLATVSRRTSHIYNLFMLFEVSSISSTLFSSFMGSLLWQVWMLQLCPALSQLLDEASTRTFDRKHDIFPVHKSQSRHRSINRWQRPHKTREFQLWYFQENHYHLSRLDW